MIVKNTKAAREIVKAAGLDDSRAEACLELSEQEREQVSRYLSEIGLPRADSFQEEGFKSYIPLRYDGHLVPAASQDILTFVATFNLSSGLPVLAVSAATSISDDTMELPEASDVVNNEARKIALTALGENVLTAIAEGALDGYSFDSVFAFLKKRLGFFSRGASFSKKTEETEKLRLWAAAQLESLTKRRAEEMSLTRKTVDSGEYIPGAAKDRSAVRKKYMTDQNPERSFEVFERMKRRFGEGVIKKSISGLAVELSAEDSDVVVCAPLVAVAVGRFVAMIKNDPFSATAFYASSSASEMARCEASTHEEISKHAETLRLLIEQAGDGLEKTADRLIELALECASRVKKELPDADQDAKALEAISASVSKYFRDNIPVFADTDGIEACYGRLASAVDESGDRRLGIYHTRSMVKAVSQSAPRIRAALEKVLAMDEESLRSAADSYLETVTHNMLVRKANKEAEMNAVLRNLKEMVGRTAVEKFVRTGGRGVDDITSPDEFTKVFGTRGLQWGNAVSEARRVDLLKRTAASFRDLGDAIGLDESSLALGGNLAVSIGARGRGGTKAQYFPETNVINLNRDNGDGSLAHEWAHALDFMGIASMITDRSRRGSLPSEVVEAVNDLRKKIFTTSREEFLEYLNALIKQYEAEIVELEPIVAANNAFLEEKFRSVTRGLDEKIKAADLELTEATRGKRGALTQEEQDKLSAISASLVDLRNARFEASSAERMASLRVAGPRLALQRIKDLVARMKATEESTQKGEYRRLSEFNGAYQSAKMVDGKEAYPSKFSVDSENLDRVFGKTKGYYATGEEMFARAFETFVSNALANKGASNNYLVELGTHEKEGLGMSAYPTGKEQERINEALAVLIAALKKNGII